MLNFAIKATENAIAVGEEYFCSRLTKSFEFFKSKEMPYLKENYCLDTGLPGRENTRRRNQSLYQIERFAFGVETISKNYTYFKSMMKYANYT